jgi:outer membrane lipoprotein-sorting protein
MQLIRSSIILFAMLFLFTLFGAGSRADGASKVFLPKSFRAKFTQQFKRSLHGKTKENNGVLDYRSPGNFRFELKGKTNMIVVSNPLKTWHYKPPFIKGQRGELKISATKKSTFVSFFDMISSGLKSNKDYKVSEVDGGVKLVFAEEKVKEIGIREGFLYFQKGKKRVFENLTSFSLVYKNGKNAKFIFSKIEINKIFTTKHFEFHAPPGTRKSNI